MAKMSYSKIILDYLRKQPKEIWTPSYNLEKVWIDGHFIGTSGARRCREMAETGQIEVRHIGAYAEYRALLPKTIDVYSVGGAEIYRRNNY